MALDINSLTAFYDSALGDMARRRILPRLRGLWPNTSQQRILGFGFATPYLEAFRTEAERVVAAMPAVQGVIRWSPSGRGLSTLVLEDCLPFADASFDRILLIHGLEACAAERHFMRELWRVLAAEGRLIVVTPNRTSLWAQFETSPFGHGRPYSRRQLSNLLEQSLFRAERWEAALMTPPLRKRKRSGTGWEGIGRRMWPAFAGVHIVEASKSLYAMAAVPRGHRRVKLAQEPAG